MSPYYTLATAIGSPDSKTFRVMSKPFRSIAEARAEWREIRNMLQKHPCECHSLLFKTAEFNRLMDESIRLSARDTWNVLIAAPWAQIPLAD